MIYRFTHASNVLLDVYLTVLQQVRDAIDNEEGVKKEIRSALRTPLFLMLSLLWPQTDMFIMSGAAVQKWRAVEDLMSCSGLEVPSWYSAAYIHRHVEYIDSFLLLMKQNIAQTQQEGKE